MGENTFVNIKGVNTYKQPKENENTETNVVLGGLRGRVIGRASADKIFELFGGFYRQQGGGR
ncbi:MAG TPA: hypothetical protein DCR35_20050 [Runella sp.]|nr:hypothetical protein [Runella sp.]HAO51400.1 hypothetical protein [Runella sp.]